MTSTSEIETAVDTAFTEARTDIALLFNWKFDTVTAFVARDNTLPDAAPSWLTTTPPHMIGTSLMNDIVAHLAPLGSGHLTRIMVSTLDAVQYGNIVSRLSAIEMHPFFQAAWTDGPIANIGLLQVVNGKHSPRNADRVPPFELRQVFA
ncbi:unnamed protein product [Phytophthora fragariaefolia]|uniref:Unnamed protein product n=1 Tax=Phytophthora fragariaefolia TaxID=1490495 RepID=A0A9W7D6K6_9STRA|nr:unnamed protein product [Phytophthora fragariaefolia]